MSSLLCRQTNWLFLFLLSPPLFVFHSSSPVSVDHPLFFSCFFSHGLWLFPFLFSLLCLSAPVFDLPASLSVFSHVSPFPPTSPLSRLSSPLHLSLSISASSSSVDILGGGTGCVGGSAGQRSNHRFSIGWSSSWFSSTLWPSPLNITSSLSG